MLIKPEVLGFDLIYHHKPYFLNTRILYNIHAVSNLEYIYEL